MAKAMEQMKEDISEGKGSIVKLIEKIAKEVYEQERSKEPEAV